jgi:hypothetical protein
MAVEVQEEKAARFFASPWVIAKLIYMLLNFLFGAIAEHDWSTGGAPAWIISLLTMCMFGFMMFMRFTGPREKWTERALWAANPFRDFSAFRHKSVFFT